MRVSLIAARSRNGAIGRSGDIPWSAPEDLAFFSKTTRGHLIVMGRKTWESLPKKPLPGRVNVVLSSGEVSGAIRAVSVEDALLIGELIGVEELFVIGGEAVYAAFLPFADRLLITEVDVEVSDADAFFPQINEPEWRETDGGVLRAEDPRCSLRILTST